MFILFLFFVLFVLVVLWVVQYVSGTVIDLRKVLRQELAKSDPSASPRPHSRIKTPSTVAADRFNRRRYLCR